MYKTIKYTTRYVIHTYTTPTQLTYHLCLCRKSMLRITICCIQIYIQIPIYIRRIVSIVIITRGTQTPVSRGRVQQLRVPSEISRMKYLLYKS